MKLLADYKREHAYSLSGQTPPRRPSSLEVRQVYEPSDKTWRKKLGDQAGIVVEDSASRFAVGQCTWLAYLARSDFPFDSRGGGRNDAKNWLDQASKAGWPVGRFVIGEPIPLPQRGAILVHKAWPGNPSGHVSIVSEIISERCLVVWDCNFSSDLDGKVRERVIELDDYVAGYIYRDDATWRNMSSKWLLSPVGEKGFGTLESSDASDGPYWSSVVRLSPDVSDYGQIFLEIYPDLERKLDLDVYVWPERFTIRLPKSAANVAVAEVGPVPVSKLPDRYVVVLVRPNRITSSDKPIKRLLAYVKYSTLQR